MPHVRELIRDAAVSALAGIAGGRIYASRAYNVQQGELPALLVYTLSERSDAIRLSMAGARRLQRTLDLAVEVYASGASVDDALDALCVEVEEAMHASAAAGGLAALIEDMTLSATQVGLAGDGNRSVGVAQLRYTIEYHTAEGAPSAALA